MGREGGGKGGSAAPRANLAPRSDEKNNPTQPLPPQMRAGLQGQPSTLMMLPSMVDVLPDG